MKVKAIPNATLAWPRGSPATSQRTPFDPDSKVKWQLYNTTISPAPGEICHFRCVFDASFGALIQVNLVRAIFFLALSGSEQTLQLV
jgi:hypothetical protein